MCTALRGDLAGFRSQADAENCILTCGKAHYAYCLMEMAENRHNLREQCRCMFLLNEPLYGIGRGAFFMYKLNIELKRSQAKACEKRNGVRDPTQKRYYKR